MRICSVDGCNNKHHGRGYCKKHYNKIVLSEICRNIPCVIDGCDNHKSMSSGKLNLCDKHYSRLKRNNSTEVRKRNRDFITLVETLSNSDDIMNYNFKSLNNWSIICKLFYGDKCMKCEWDEWSCEAHHKIPRSKGGENTLSNCEILCPNCHSKHHSNKDYNRFSEETLKELEKMFDEIKQNMKF